MKRIIAQMNLYFLSILAAIALFITGVAANQRCWYIMYDDKLPDNAKRLRKFKK